MGRMSDARKRARRADGAGPTPPPDSEEPAAAAPPEPPPAPPPEEIVFPSEAPPAPSHARIELPPSGLAADILAREDAAAVDAESPLSPPEPAPAAPARAHSVSFFAAPVREERAAAEATEHLATFFLDREEYGVDVRLVQEIRRVTEITSVPRAPEFIKGVINLRGRIIPVVDLKRKLRLGEVGIAPASRIVVVKIRERLLGLLVDGASQVLKIPVSSIDAPPDEVVEKGGDYIRGVAKLERRLIILVDLLKILAVELQAAGSPAGEA
jgi:purine-binding chemotaxis protein CheW